MVFSSMFFERFKTDESVSALISRDRLKASCFKRFIHKTLRVYQKNKRGKREKKQMGRGLINNHQT